MIRTAKLSVGAMLIAVSLTGSTFLTAAEPESKDIVQTALAKLPAASPAEAVPIYQELIKAPDNVVKLVGLLRAPGKEDDSKARFALHGMALYVHRPNAEAERKLLSETLARQLDADLPPQVKAFLIMQLQLAGGPEAVPAIGKVLLDKELCEYGAQALVRIRGEEATAALREALPKAEDPCRLTLIQALGVLRDAKSAPTILKAIADPSRDIRLAAASALGNIGEPTAADALLKAAEVEPFYERSQATDAVLLLARRLGEAGQKKEAERLCRALLKTHAAPEERHVRGAALQALASAVGAAAMDDVLAAMSSEDPQLRSVAITAAVAMPGKDATQRWAEQMRKANPAGRAAILALLARRADSAALPAILEGIKDSEEPVRLAAYDALATTGTAEAVGPLVAVLASVLVIDRERPAIRGALVRIPGDAVTAAIAKAVPEAPSLARSTLLDVLAARRATAHLDVILACTKDAEEAVSAAAVNALGALADAKELPTLMAILKETDKARVREAAEKALAATCGRAADKGKCVDLLVAGLDGAPTPVRAALLRVLGGLGGPKALEAARAGLKDKEDAIREAAVRSLAAWPDDTAAPDLLEAAKSADKEGLQVLALRGYARFIGFPAGRSLEQRLKMCGDAMDAARRDEEKRLVLSALAEVPSVEALKMAEPFLAQKALAAEGAMSVLKIARAISGTSRDEARAAIQKAAEATDNADVRKQAAEALSNIDKFAGYITAWLAAGPYRQAGKDMAQLFNIPFDPEKPDAKDVQWKTATAQGDAPPFVDLNRILGGGEGVAGYLRVQVFSPKAQDAVMEFGSDDGLKVWLNGEVIDSQNVPRSLAAASDRVTVKLREGWNLLLLKITQGGGDWSACARIRSADGKPLEGLKTKAE